MIPIGDSVGGFVAGLLLVKLFVLGRTVRPAHSEVTWRGRRRNW